jgi:hypothetical protein
MRSGVGAICALTLDLLLDLEEADFDETRLFLVLEVDECVEVEDCADEDACAASGSAAPDTTEAALRNAAPRMGNQICLVIGPINFGRLRAFREAFKVRVETAPEFWQVFRRLAKELWKRAAETATYYCSGAGTTPAR